ncbi:MAG TPA: PA14 domain-containing protein, partial [Luteolibacter sp.]|nr:PA14 domain-containing protein [Luteolibacter sp.]
MYPVRLAAIVTLMVSATMRGQIDDNANGLSDVWEAAHPAGLIPDADDDGDGFKNREEAAAGTDPRDPRSFPHIRELTLDSPGRFTKTWPTVAGVRYQPMVSGDMTAWSPVGPPVIGTGEEHQQVLDATSVVSSGSIRRTRWATTGWSLSPVKSYAASATPPAPLIDDTLTRLETLQSSPDLENYGQWLRGWIVAPETGTYTFWIASDDGSEFWLSNDKNPAGKTLRCAVSGWTNTGEWTKYPGQRSAPIQLNAGQTHYFEIFHIEGGGGDHLAVAWTRPGMAEGTREIIAGNALASSGDTLGELMSGGERLFFRLGIQHTDSDGDGVSDYEEHLLGLNPLVATTTPRVADAETARRTLASPSVVTLGVAIPRAYEEGTRAARFMAFRSGGIGPLTVPYAVSGTATTGADFQPLPGEVHFPPG